MVRGVFFFMAYAFLGWLVECCYTRLMDGHWVNRGFLHGPFLPIYGFGGVITVYILQKISEHVLLLFLVSFFFLSLLEYVTSWIAEKAFKIKWWDYSQHKFNLSGRVCLLNSFYWGLAGVAVTELLHPALTELAALVGARWQFILAAVFLLYFLVDLSLALRRAADFGKVLGEWEAHAERLEQEIREKQRQYEEKARDYEKNMQLYREKWRHSVAEAKERRLRGLAAQGTEFQKKMEQLNEDLRLTLKQAKEELAAAANRREGAVNAAYQRFYHSIRQMLEQNKAASHYRNMRGLLHAFPSSLPLSDRFAGEGLWPAIRSIIKEKRNKRRNYRKLNEGGEEMKKYVCSICGYVYDPAAGDADSGIAPGTAFEDIPDDWVCPDCGVGKDMFEVQE
ncbi:MAG: rubredoxin [Syntrophomonadaceae bacterium]|jgi:uncharacterized membrane protein/rubredoxin|nr:rubredoxin [Syntrophomonadaceae bacterium]